MATPEKKPVPFDFNAKIVQPVYTFFEKRIIANKLQYEPYAITIIWGYFFFFWLYFHPIAAAYASTFFLAAMPFVLPALFWEIMDASWFEYVRQEKFWATEHCVLEIRLPDEITQSPYGTELFLRGIYQTGEVDTPLHEFWGNTRPWFSLEIASINGRVAFYVWTRRKFKNIVETQMYAHYPSVQIVEVPDYTLLMPFDLAKVDVWGIEQGLQKPDPYPILTYVEAGLNKAETKEEFKNDPLASMIELLGSIKEGEHIWIQNIIRAHTSEAAVAPYSEDLAGHTMNISQWTKYEIMKVATDAKAVTPEGVIQFIQLSELDKLKIQSMQFKENKQLYDVGMRALYIARRDVANNAPRIGIPSAYRSFEHGSEGRGLNGLKPIFWIGPFNYQWQDLWGIRRRMLQRRFYEAYVTRSFFFEPHKHKWIVLNSEEIATLWHLPGRVVSTPNLERLPSKRGEAPVGLPV